MGTLRIAGAQLENVVGDLAGNRERILDAMRWAEGEGADVLLLPELALTGYPLEDLALRSDFVAAAGEELKALAAQSQRLTTVIGTIEGVPPRSSWDIQPRSVANAAALVCDGEVRGIYHKVLLPTYGVFDEARSFAPGTEPAAVWGIGETTAGVCICEDIWSGDGPPEAQASAGAELLLVLNASPFHRHKPERRLALAGSVARRNGIPLVYVNCVGAQGELVFDGGSLVLDSDGDCRYRADQFEATRFCLDLETPSRPGRAPTSRTVHARGRAVRAPLALPPSSPQLEELEQIWRALVVGTRDFAQRGGAGAAVLGLSGGIDAAVTAAIAADALGPQHVLGVAMPTTDAPPEVADAERVASGLGIRFSVMPLAAIMTELDEGLRPLLQGRPVAGVRHDLVARMRGATLLAIAEELGRIALATGNKTELSIGSATLHGDMAGAFAPIKDCPKTLVYELARHRNARGGGAAIPEEILAKPPSRLLRDGVDARYEVLDPIVERYIEKAEGFSEIVGAGLDPTVVRGVLQLIDDAEPQRRLIPPGVKISERAFGKDRRMPITNAWRPFSADEARIAPTASATHNVPTSEKGAGR